eukprot:11395095-Ditylum_brightwellii.AAC.1
MADLLMNFILHVKKEDPEKATNMRDTFIDAKELIPSALRIGETGKDKYVTKTEDDALHNTSYFMVSNTYSYNISIYTKATALGHNNIGSLTVEDGT